MSKPDDIESQLKFLCDLLHQYQGFEARQRKKIDDRKFYRALAHTLESGVRAQFAGNVFSVVNLRSVHGKAIQTAIPIHRTIRPDRQISAFIGHRFHTSVTKNLRHNLAIILKSYRINPIYSDTDSPNGPVFQVILNRIRKCDFAIFDDRETETRPNTLIEIGAAIALNKPYFYFNYQNKRTVQIGRSRERITTASDLAECFTCHIPTTTLCFRNLRSAYRSF